MKDHTVKFNILVSWFGRNWGEGRTFEKVAEHLSRLPEVNNVVCVFPPRPINGKSWSRPLEIRRVGKKIALLTQSARVVPTDSRPYRLRMLINKYARDYLLPAYLHFLGFRKETTILWVFPPHPYLDELIPSVPHTMLVTHIVDNFTKLENEKWLSDCAAEQYPRLQSEADIIITGSEVNHQLFSKGRQHSYLFENAVDESFIATPSLLPCRDGSSPRLGYIGTISQRTDIALLECLARKKPEWTFLIAGRQEVMLSEEGILRLPNVQYMGVIPYEDLPRFLTSLDVCLIPHRITEYSRSMSPLKLYQYLASGRPIVSTNIEGLSSFKKYIYIRETCEEFQTGIEDAIREDSIELSSCRIDAARKETWDKRVHYMFDVVKLFLKTKVSKSISAEVQ